jgi:acyl-homoserine-lactone acylase
MRRVPIIGVLRGMTAGALLASVAAGGLAQTATAGSPGPYAATIVRDEFGVPHITAADWGSVAFGQGYAQSEDRACTVIDQVVKVRGERARWFGPGENDEHVNSDFAYHHLGLWEDAPSRWADQSDRVHEVIDGYVAGFNAQLADNGIAGWCADEPWVGPITVQDMYAYISDILLLASSRNLIQEIGNAQPPAPASEATTAETAPVTEPVGFAGSPLAFAQPGASNGWALGADRSTTGGGLLLANPHFPWEGELRFWENHLTIPGKLNVYGVGLTGLPGVQIGFNDAVAWTHTVSAGHRFTLYRYDLDPTDPTTYIVDSEPQSMIASEYTIDVLGTDGATTTLTRTLYSTHHGPVVNVAPLGWTADQAIAIRDGNIEITNVLEQYLGMDAATSMDEFQAVHEANQGVPWVNTISTSSDGRAWLADTSATPNLSPEALAAWEAELAAGGLIGLAYDTANVVMLDGSDSLFDWVDDPGAPAPGLVPYSQVPQLERTDYVFNANDSFWLTNPDELLTGFSPLAGAEAVPQSPRTRTNVMLLGESTEPWALEDVQSAIFSDRSLFVETVLPALVEACTATPMVTLDGVDVDLHEACDVLAAWDGTYTLDARGAILFREWNSLFGWQDRQRQGAFFDDDFDPADPAGTPSDPVDDRTIWLENLGTAVQLLDFLGIPIDAPLGDWQFEVRTGDRIPIHGGTNNEGLANIVDCCSEVTGLGPVPSNGENINDSSYLTDLPGYPISRGASFVMTLQFGPDGPAAEAILTYGNPDDPSDPAYRAGLEAFSAGEWRPLRFTESDVAAIESGSATEVVGERT